MRRRRATYSAGETAMRIVSALAPLTTMVMGVVPSWKRTLLATDRHPGRMVWATGGRGVVPRGQAPHLRPPEEVGGREVGGVRVDLTTCRHIDTHTPRPSARRAHQPLLGQIGRAHV